MIRRHPRGRAENVSERRASAQSPGPTLRPVPRLRQAVLAARDLEPVVAELRAQLGLGAPFRDPAVAHFGLSNAVLALGDTFVEVVSPAAEGTAAGRHLERLGGDGGYMVMFEVDDLAAARARAAAAGIREAFAVELPDILDVHLHPRDIGGAIVALDAPVPPRSWRWGGPEWEGAVPPHEPGGLTGATLAGADPVATAERWAHVLGVTADGASIPLDGGTIDFVAGEPDRLVAVSAQAPAPARADIAGVSFVLERAAEVGERSVAG
jgi:hypothetical protein